MLINKNLGVVPTRNTKFVEREQLFKDLTARFAVRDGSQARVALFGLGGVGFVPHSLQHGEICLT